MLHLNYNDISTFFITSKCPHILTSSSSSESLSLSDVVSRLVAVFRTLVQSVSTTDAVTGAWGTQKYATAYITDRTSNSSITKRTANAEVMIE